MLSHVFFVLGYAVGAAAFWWLAARRGLNTEGVATVMGAGLIGGLIFGNFFELVTTGEPGKTVIGAVVGGYVTIIVYKHIIGLKRPMGDLFAIALSAGEAVGRWGCFFGGCCYGKVTTMPWAIWQHGAWRQPTQIYHSLAAAVTFCVLLYCEKRSLLPENGLFYLQGVMFCAFRFVIEFYRIGQVFAAGLTLAQIACILGFGFFGYKLTTLAPRHQVAVAA
jgi:phosphatidylglycerol---prolipoprotein diacylglyceryl transferase